MANIDEFERQVWEKEGVRIVVRSWDSTMEIIGYAAKAAPQPDEKSTRQFRNNIEMYLNGVPFAIIGGNGRKPGLNVTMGEVRASYGDTPKKPKSRSIGKVEGEPIAREMLDRLGSPDKTKERFTDEQVNILDHLVAEYKRDPESVRPDTFRRHAKRLGVPYTKKAAFVEWYEKERFKAKSKKKR